MEENLSTAMSPNLSDLIDSGSFSEVCNSFYKLFEVPVRALDAKGNLLAEAVRSFPACKKFCDQEEARKLCIATRMKVKNVMPDSKRLMSIDCLTGLRYTAAPITYQGSTIGKLVFGPYRPVSIGGESGRIFDRDANIELEEIAPLVEGMRKTPSSVIRKVATAMLAVLDSILFSSHKALITSQMHLASIQESHKELTLKNRELEEMHEQMKEFERIKSSFLSTVSHELRTPLTSIIGYSDLLSEGIAGDLGDEQLQFIETIKTKGEELLKLISSILDFSQIESGRLNLIKRETDPQKLVEKVVEDVTDTAARRGIRVSCTFGRDLLPIIIDEERIRAAVSHLVDNAIKFSSPSSMVKVSAQIASSEADPVDEDEGFGMVLMAAPDWLDISVEDYGDGIPEEEHKRIFDPFTQLDDSTTREYGGAGLGLAVVKQLVEAHGGRVCVTSTPNQGSNFTIRLPIMGAE